MRAAKEQKTQQSRVINRYFYTHMYKNRLCNLIKNNSIIQKIRHEDKPTETKLTKEACREREREQQGDLTIEQLQQSKAYFNPPKMYYDQKMTIPVDSKVIFVLSTDDNLYIRKEPHGIIRQDGFTHANFFSGNPIKAAGQMFVRDGIITRIDNESGHYKPKDVTIEWVLDYLKGKVCLSKINLVMNQGERRLAYNAQEYDNAISYERINPINDNFITRDEEFQQKYDSSNPELTLLYDKFYDFIELIPRYLKKFNICKLRLSTKESANLDEKIISVKTIIKQKCELVNIESTTKIYPKCTFLIFDISIPSTS